ncbi:MAG: hypothetical protein JNK33_01610 [Candidatus Doudnabacteria bacterium]|nr:hypothetical protein [Candidatus Doudnabacteria bacterium]
MADFKKSGGFGGHKGRGGFGDKRGGGRPNFGGRPGFGGGRDDRRSEMFTATCSDCGNQCQVPFRPNGSKPVYCDNCFSAKRDGYSNDFAGGAPKHRSQQPDTFSFGAPAPKHTPAQSTTTTPSDKRLDELKKQVDALSAKIDKLLHIAQNGPQSKLPGPAAAPQISKSAQSSAITPPAVVKAAVKKPATPTPKKVVAKATAKKKTAGKKK